SLDQKQLDKRTTNLQMSVMFNRVCLFAAKKLRQYQTSGFHAISGIVTILLLFVLTMFVFGAINYGLHKIDSSLFDLSTPATLFIFVYYIFNTLIFTSI